MFKIMLIHVLTIVIRCALKVLQCSFHHALSLAAKHEKNNINYSRCVYCIQQDEKADAAECVPEQPRCLEFIPAGESDTPKVNTF